MTPGQLNTAMRQRYNAVGDTFFSDAEVYDIIYQACMIMAQECFVIENTYTTTSVSGTREYAYPTSAIAIRRVEYDGDKVEPAPWGMDSDPKTSTTEVSGDPKWYSLWNDEIIFYPTPSATGDTIKIFTFNEPQAISSSSTLEIPTLYHLDIIDFGLSVFYAKDGNQSMSQFYDRKWQENLARIKRTQAKRKRGDQFAVVRDDEDGPNIFGVISG